MEDHRPRGQPTLSVKAQMSILSFVGHMQILSYIFLWDFKKQLFKNIKTILSSRAV